MILQWVSLLGSLFLLSAYTLLTLKKITPDGFLFYTLNLLGCIVLGITLIFGQFNLGSFVLQVVFGFISIYGIWQNLGNR